MAAAGHNKGYNEDGAKIEGTGADTALTVDDKEH